MARPKKQKPAPQPVGKAPAPDFRFPYIASSETFYSLPAYYGLPQTIDDAEERFGLDIYDKMLHDPDLSGFMLGLKSAVLESEVQVLPAVKAPSKFGKQDPGQEAKFKKAKEVADFVESCHDLLPYTDRPLTETMWDMLEALSHGHRLAEVVFRPETEGVLAGKWVIESLGVKPQSNYAYVCDNNNRVLGVTAKIPGLAPYVRQGLIGDPSNLPNIVPKSKFWHFAPHRRNNDPRGRSLLRGAYVPWKKDQFAHEEEAKFLTQFAGGMITAELPEKVPDGKYTHPTTGASLSFADYVGYMLSQLGNGQYGVFPNGCAVEIHQPSNDGKAFDLAFQRNRQAKAMAVTSSIRAFLEAQHSSKADSESADDSLFRFIRVIRYSLCQSYRMGVLYQLVKANFGKEAALDFLPEIRMAGAQEADFTDTAAGLASLKVEPPTQSKKALFEERTGIEWIDDGQQEEPAETPPDGDPED